MTRGLARTNLQDRVRSVDIGKSVGGRLVSIQPLCRIGLIVLAAAALHGQTYYSAAKPDCSSLAEESAVAITNSSGTTIGYSCYVSGAFIWLAAGGGWGTSIRVAAPASAPIGVEYSFYDTSGRDLALDLTVGRASQPMSRNSFGFSLSANQPAEVTLLGATSSAPKYGATSTGSVYAVFYCPDATTCRNVLPQLLYSALPATPWSLSVPITWDTELSTQWSAEGIDAGSAHRVSLAIYNEDVTATSYAIRVYDSTGSLAGTGATPSIPPLRALSGGSLGQGGTYGALLSDLVSTPLPPGVFKVVVDGGSKYSAGEALQFNGPAATALQVAYDSGANSIARAAPEGRPSPRSAHVASTSRVVFDSLAQ